MKNLSLSPSRLINRFRERRRGSVLMLSAGMLVMIFGFAAFTIDIGYITLTKTQLQVASDASVLAGGSELSEAWGVGASRTIDEAQALAREVGADVAGRHRAGDVDSAYLDENRDMRFGRREWNSNTGSWQESWGSPPYNMVEVVLRRDQGPAGADSLGDSSLPLFFGPIIGSDHANLSTSAVAAMIPGSGIRVKAGAGYNAMMLPFALRVEVWDDFVAGNGQDKFSWDPDTKTVSHGSDGVLEMNLYLDELSAGNLGTVDLGASGNSTNDIKRQILEGLNASDLEHLGGEIDFAYGPVLIGGDTGLSAGFEDELKAIIGQPRLIPLFTDQWGPGNNAVFECVRFAAIRLMDVRLTGANKRIFIQPAVFMHPSIIASEPQELREDSIFTPLKLIR
jgi:hypothetical protein